MDDFLDQFLEIRLPVYVLMDGALVDNVEIILAANDLEGTPIFKSRDRGVKLAGPWLVRTRQDRKTLERAAGTAQACRSGVCWAADCDEDDFIRHVRTLNIARLPDDRVVWFRHYDPDVLAFLAPMFNAEQAAKLFGPAYLIGFLAGRGSGATVSRPGDLLDAKNSPLTFEDWQMNEIDRRQRTISKDKIANALREIFPHLKEQSNSIDMLREVERHDVDAAKIGLTSERGVFQWAQLSILSGGQVNRDLRLHEFLRHSGPSQINKTLDDNFENILASIKLSAGRI